MTRVDEVLALAGSEIQFQATKSSGPGGQHVNKTNTKITLRWAINESTALSDREKVLIREKLGAHISSQDVLIIANQESRSQIQNKENTIAKLKSLLKKAFQKRKVRKPSKPTKASIARRLDQKKRISEKKQLRRNTK